jgi:hypothetical protein
MELPEQPEQVGYRRPRGMRNLAGRNCGGWIWIHAYSQGIASARAVVAELERQAARQRVARERVERMSAALEERKSREAEAAPARRAE